MKKVENFARLNLLSFQEQLQNGRDLGVYRKNMLSMLKKAMLHFQNQLYITGKVGFLKPT